MGVLCDKNVPSKINGKFYRSCVWPAAMYKDTSVGRPMRKRKLKMKVAETWMSRWPCCGTRVGQNYERIHIEATLEYHVRKNRRE